MNAVPRPPSLRPEQRHRVARRRLGLLALFLADRGLAAEARAAQDIAMLLVDAGEPAGGPNRPEAWPR